MLQTEPDDLRTNILDYLADHPDAEDTLEGIAEWWLLERCIRRQLPAVQQALEELVADGLLISRSASGSEPRYRYNREARSARSSQSARDDDPVSR